MSENRMPLVKRGLITTELTDEVLVYDPETMEAHSLNRVAAFVFQRCDGERTRAEVASALRAECGVDDAEELLRYALALLERKGFFEKSEVSVGRALSRRQLMDRAVKAAVLLPVVATLLAPTPAMAGSCIAAANCQATNHCGAQCDTDGCAGGVVCATSYTKTAAATCAGDTPFVTGCQSQGALGPFRYSCTDARNLVGVGAGYMCCNCP